MTQVSEHDVKRIDTLGSGVMPYGATSPAKAAVAGDHLEVLDGELKNLYKVPLDAVSHMPPEQLHITRLVLCRNYEPGNPESCPLGDACKFVHVECYVSQLEAPSTVHVKYCWHHEDECCYPRLPAGELLRVAAPNNRLPFEGIPSEMVLATRGSLNRHTHAGQLSHCAHYFFNKMCKRGSECHFIHAIVIDPKNVPSGHFSRASSGRTRKIVPLDPPVAKAYARSNPSQPRLYPEAVLMEDVPAAAATSARAARTFPAAQQMYQRMFQSAPPPAQPRVYRHNPYSVMKTTVWLLG